MMESTYLLGCWQQVVQLGKERKVAKLPIKRNNLLAKLLWFQALGPVHEDLCFEKRPHES